MHKWCQNEIKPKVMVLYTQKLQFLLSLNTENFYILKMLRTNLDRRT